MRTLRKSSWHECCTYTSLQAGGADLSNRGLWRRRASGKLKGPLKVQRKSNRTLEPSGPAQGVVLKRRKRGQVLVMLAILIPVLLGVVAAGVDITVFYWTWSRMQSAADSAVLAGAASLPDSPSLAIAQRRHTQKPTG
jgi:hypothetical protein